MWMYKKNKDNSSRYILGEKGKRPLVCFGINPSTAEPDNLDNTLRQVKSMALIHKYEGWIMLNLYPQRATNPDDMHPEMDNGIHAKNLYHIRNVFTEHPKATVWAAWGGIINYRPFLKKCLRDIVNVTRPHSLKWVNKGELLRNGHPHHPLYLRQDAPFQKFDIKKYLNK